MQSSADRDDGIDPRSTVWLTRGLESLVLDRLGEDQAAESDGDAHFDVVIVGSGYGGSVAAAELTRANPRVRDRVLAKGACARKGLDAASSKGVSVCVLERGSEYLAGMFPERFADLAGHVRFSTPKAPMPRGQLDGLFDFRVGSDVNVLVASGVGGGSLINAGVMKMPSDSVFQEACWPQQIRSANLTNLSAEMRQRLGAQEVVHETAKVGALRLLSKDVRLAPITVAAAPGPNNSDVRLDACVRCGNCVTGCNHNAKDSLDLNLLREAFERGAEIYTGATVLRLEKCTAGWRVLVTHTERHLRERQGAPFGIRARKVILCAGTLGSTEILLRSQSDDLAFSGQLGKQFSANGDAIAVVRDLADNVNGVADEATAPQDREVGPTISALIDVRDNDPSANLVIEDLAIPASLRQLFEEVVACAGTLDSLLDPGVTQQPDEHHLDPAAVGDALARRSLVVAVITRDGADGEILRKKDADASAPAQGHLAEARSDGLATIRWPSLRDDPRFVAAHAWLQEHARCTTPRAGQPRPRVLANPIWRPVSERLEYVFGQERGPMFTVHPLGGCPMGDDVRSGVVDDLGRVFNRHAPTASKPHHDGLYVLDGSIVPTSLGINPALTIATLALRASRALAREMEVAEAPVAESTPCAIVRPAFAEPKAQVPQPTSIELIERLYGTVHLRGQRSDERGHGVELTVVYQAQQLSRLRSDRWSERVLLVDEGKSELRVYDAPPRSDGRQDGKLLVKTKVTGELRVFRRERSTPWWRKVRGLAAWFVNRGLRDAAQKFISWGREWLGFEKRTPRMLCQYVRDIWRLSDHSGAVRLLEYDLEATGATLVATGASAGTTAEQWNGRVVGVKRLRYSSAGNPWQQLMNVELLEFPRRESWWGRLLRALHALGDGLGAACSVWRSRDRLMLDLNHLAGKGVPLLRIVGQQDRPKALADLLSFALYAVRVIVDVHALSFRKPDPALPGVPQRLVGAIARVPPAAPGAPQRQVGADACVPPAAPAPHVSAEVVWLVEGEDPETGRPARFRLTHYRRDRKLWGNPVLLVHGYSASGTTFLHPAVPGNVCETLVDAGRDVWIIDMRSSCAMPTARSGWSFEELSHDIVRAVDTILAKSGAARIDVVAHCMGSASLNMALLGQLENENPIYRRIGRVVMSQVGPVMQMSPPNVFRGYVMRWIKQFLPLAEYSFRPTGKMLGEQIMDRLFATMPYPEGEYRLENPLWPPGKATPWVSLRHRMDALYARAFKLANMTEPVLERIDDFFGPLSVETVSQVIHFARLQTIANSSGRNLYVSPFRLRSRMTFPVLYLHGEENGIVEVCSIDLMRKHWNRASLKVYPACEGTVSPHLLRKIGRRRGMEGRGSLLTWRIPGQGHQDPLIGRQAADTSKAIVHFLGAKPP